MELLIVFFREVLFNLLFPEAAKRREEEHTRKTKSVMERHEARHPLVATLMFGFWFGLWLLVIAYVEYSLVHDLRLKFFGGSAGFTAGVSGVALLLALSLSIPLLVLNPFRWLASLYFWIIGKEKTRGRALRMSVWRSMGIIRLTVLFGGATAAASVAEAQRSAWTWKTWGSFVVVFLFVIVATGFAAYHGWRLVRRVKGAIASDRPGDRRALGSEYQASVPNDRSNAIVPHESDVASS